MRQPPRTLRKPRIRVHAKRTARKRGYVLRKRGGAKRRRRRASNQRGKSLRTVESVRLRRKGIRKIPENQTRRPRRAPRPRLVLRKARKIPRSPQLDDGGASRIGTQPQHGGSRENRKPFRENGQRNPSPQMARSRIQGDASRKRRNAQGNSRGADYRLPCAKGNRPARHRSQRA